ncbi:hypothetical protein [Guptibacillus hwajinpoensis]|uniref:Cytochrome oxidase assembly protein ShyY1 n=1 Tax=Guptibacillus hwajinpoensis TaxID=208199 RepID=A0ABU0K636_9BACL|nr:hypothetical protein [Alkalihalobacillus hemicentroti]MDQ0484831.1 cytochrome oxidase assembly protein ShyY1 [Alkalihalobacillus hemicentroti]
MDKKLMHPLILINMLINGIAMGILAHNMYTASKIGYSLTFIGLGIFFILFLAYGLIRNRRVKQSIR